MQSEKLNPTSSTCRVVTQERQARWLRNKETNKIKPRVGEEMRKIKVKKRRRRKKRRRKFRNAHVTTCSPCPSEGLRIKKREKTADHSSQ